MILDQIRAAVRKRVDEQIERTPRIVLENQVSKLPKDKDFPFYQALSGSELAFICEVKKASPSKGLIAANFPYLSIAEEYARIGASAISVLTEQDHFQGSLEYLEKISAHVAVPVLRKDFILDSYQIYQAKLLGAKAVLLIAGFLDETALRYYLLKAHQLGLSALVEAHNEQEIRIAVEIGAQIIGVNNRNLQDFTVDLNNSLRLRKLVPDSVLFIAESGIKDRNDIIRLEEAGVNGVLIGETLMRSSDKLKTLNELRGK